MEKRFWILVLEYKLCTLEIFTEFFCQAIDKQAADFFMANATYNIVFQCMAERAAALS